MPAVAAIVLAATLLAGDAMSRAATAAPLMTWPDLLGRAAPTATRRIAYGKGRLQFAELWLPTGRGPHPVVLMVHGGCWQSKVASASIMNWAAENLREKGIAVWNIEYRGVDVPGGGYPGTFADVAAGADALRAAAPTFGLDLRRLVAFGHSAGGHLAIWLAARPRLPAGSPLAGGHPLAIAAVISAGGLPDLAADKAATGAACGPEVVDLLTGSPSRRRPDVYADTSPAALLPIAVVQVIVNGKEDRVAPPWLGRDWAEKARAAGDDADFKTIEATGHVELISPGSAAWAREAAVIEQLLGRVGN